MSMTPGSREEQEKDGWITFVKTVMYRYCFSLAVAEKLANDRLVWRSAVHNLGCHREATVL